MMPVGAIKQKIGNNGLMPGEGPAGRAISLEPSRLLRFAVVLAMALVLSGCAKSYRYKLTIAVNTPEGIKRGSSVGEVSFWSVWIPASGIAHQLHGQALYLDLGPGKRPLIALVTNRLRSYYGWTHDAGPNPELMSSLYGIAPSHDLMETVVRITRQRGPHKITPDQAPDLVTFDDVNDPRSVIQINPDDLQATLGPNITWNETTLEVTDDPVSEGIEQKLPWMPYYACTMLDGDQTYRGKTLANTLSTADFEVGAKSKSSDYSCSSSPREWQQRRG